MMTKKELISKIKDGEINGLLCSTNGYDCVIADNNRVITIDEKVFLDWLFGGYLGFDDWEAHEAVSDDELYKMYENDCIAYYENGKIVIINDHEFQQRVKFHLGAEVIDIIEIKNKIFRDLSSQMQVSDENYVFQWRWEDDHELYYTWLTAGVEKHLELDEIGAEDVIDLFDNTDFFKRCYEIALKTHEAKPETVKRLLENSHPSITEYLKDAELDYYQYQAHPTQTPEYKIQKFDVQNDSEFECIDTEIIEIDGGKYNPVNFGETTMGFNEKEYHFLPVGFESDFWMVFKREDCEEGGDWIPEIYPCESLDDCIDKINEAKNTNVDRDFFEKINDAYYPIAFI